MTEGNLKQWMILSKEKEYGPYSLDHLRKYVGEGRIKPSSVLRRQDQAAPRRADSISGLFPEAGAKPGAHRESATIAPSQAGRSGKEFYILGKEGKRYGPYLPERLKSFAAEGRINPGTRMFSCEIQREHSARRIKGLFDEETIAQWEAKQAKLTRQATLSEPRRLPEQPPAPVPPMPATAPSPALEARPHRAKAHFIEPKAGTQERKASAEQTADFSPKADHGGDRPATSALSPKSRPAVSDLPLSVQTDPIDDPPQRTPVIQPFAAVGDTNPMDLPSPYQFLPALTVTTGEETAEEASEATTAEAAEETTVEEIVEETVEEIVEIAVEETSEDIKLQTSIGRRPQQAEPPARETHEPHAHLQSKLEEIQNPEDVSTQPNQSRPGLEPVAQPTSPEPLPVPALGSPLPAPETIAQPAQLLAAAFDNDPRDVPPSAAIPPLAPEPRAPGPPRQVKGVTSSLHAHRPRDWASLWHSWATLASSSDDQGNDELRQVIRSHHLPGSPNWEVDDPGAGLGQVPPGVKLRSPSSPVTPNFSSER